MSYKLLDLSGLQRFFNKLKDIIPTKTSELQNDSGYITQSDTVDSALSSTSEKAVQNKVIKQALDLKADDSSVVHTTGNESISGTKSFNSDLNLNYASTDVDDIIDSIPGLGTADDYVHISGNETINGIKSFPDGIVANVSGTATPLAHTHTTSDITNLSIPSKVSDLTNDSGFITGVSWNDVSGKPSSFTPSSHTHGSITNDGKLGTASRALITDGNKKIAVSSVTSTELGYLSGVTSAVQDQLDGKAASTHSHTASEVSGLATVATSGSYNDLSNKPTIPTVNNATLTIQKNGTTVKTFTANASSNVTANITVPTKVSELTNDSGYLTSASNLDSSKLTGTIDIARLPKGALERLVTVADQTARFALTTSDVQLGDTVKQLDTGVMYIVTDESKLSSADGYTEYTAGAATSVPWSGVTGKPSTYTPASHTHGNITNDGKLGTASKVLITDSNKKITTSSVSNTELGYLSGVTSAIQTQISGKANASHTHSASDITSGLATVATSGSYNDLSNKPTIPTVNNATLTIQKNGTTVKTFTANASSNVTANIVVPTKTSDLTNDSHQTITAGTDSTSTASPAHGGTFTCIDSVTKDSNGHVTAVNTKTVTLPSDNNTDTLVTQNVSTANENHPILLTVTKDATNNQGAKTSIFASGVKVNPSTNTVTATTFSGALSGNASSATQFSANKSVTLTGDVTGTASSKAGWSVATTLSDSGVTAGTYGPSADVTGNNNATISVPEITVDSKGRVTSVANRTLTCKNNTYTVNNATLTIQKNGTNVATFTSNASANATANITVPTKVSELTNDSKFTSCLNSGNGINFDWSTQYTNKVGIKVDNTWVGGILTTTNTAIPTKTSQLTNDSGFLTSHQSLSNYVTLNGTQTITGAKTFSGLTKTAGKTEQSSPSDLNDALYNVESYSWGTSTTNKPSSSYGILLNLNREGNVHSSTSNGWRAQLGVGTDTRLYLRTKANTGGEWSAWKEFLTSHQSLSNYSTLANTIKSLSISGKTITYTKGDNTTGTLTTQDTNTDTLMTQNVSTTNATYPILLTATADASANLGAKTGIFGSGVKVNPSTSIISAKGFSGAPGTNYVQGVRDGGALVNSQTTSFGAVWRAPTKNYQVAGATFPSNTDTVYICYSVTNANVTAGTNTVAKQLTWAADTGTLTANAFSGPLTGNVTGNCSGSSGSCTGNSATATKATGNANGKELTNTIIKGLSISGKTITYTQIDGSTGTLTTQDTNTDTLMTQNVSTTNNKYPILLCPTAEATANQGAKTGIFGANALINPSTGEIISKSNGTGAFRVVGGNYGFFIRNDGSNTYFLMTASGDQYGSWTSARPLTISNSTGVCSINGNAATANKLATARSIALGNELAGSANFDGSGNITVNANAYLSVVGVGNKNNYPYHRFAYFGPITTQYTDAAIRLQVARQCINGGSGILEIEFRTNATNGDGDCDVRWIVRSSKLPVDCIQIGFFKTWGGIYADVFCKSTGAYDSYVIRSMGDGSRGSYERKFTLQDCSEANNTTTTDPLTSVNSYASIAAAGTALHNQAYTDILTATDAGVVETANTCSGNSATASKVVATVANDNTGALVQGTMGTNDCFRIAIGGASNAGWAEIATGDDYNEPIYVRQYQGSFATLKRTATLLDASGNTSFPGTVTATGFSGPLTGNVTGNCSGTSANVTGTVAIANGGTGATSRLNAVKALTNENVGTSSQFFLTITSSWGKAGYCSVADAKTVLGVPTKTSQLTNDSGYLTSHQSLSNYVTLNGTQTISGAKTFSSNLVYTSSLAKKHSSITKGTNPSSTAYWTIGMCDKDGLNAANNALGMFETSLDKYGTASSYLRAYKNTAGSNTVSEVRAKYDTTNDKGWITCTGEDICLISNKKTQGTVPTANQDCTFKMFDNSSHTMFEIRNRSIANSSNNQTYTAISVAPNTSGAAVTDAFRIYAQTDNSSTVCNVLTQNFLPVSNNTYNLGDNSHKWANIYSINLSVSGTGVCPTQDVSDNTGKIATTAFVKNAIPYIISGGANTSAGNITLFKGTIISGFAESNSVTYSTDFGGILTSPSHLYYATCIYNTSDSTMAFSKGPAVGGTGTWKLMGGGTSNPGTSTKLLFGLWIKIA